MAVRELIVRRPVRALVAILGVCLAFALGVLTAARHQLGDPIVQVQLENEVEKPIKLVELTYSCGDRRVKVSESDPPAAKLHHYFFVSCGDGSYRLHVTFDDGRSVASQGTYVQPGDKTVEVLDGSTITTRSHWSSTINTVLGWMRR